LHIAAFRGHTMILSSLLEKKGDVNVRDGLDHTPLHWAAFEGNIKCLQFLLSKGADIHAINQDGLRVVCRQLPIYVVGGKTALHYAAEGGELPCVQALIEKGASVRIKDFDGYTPFHLASMHNRYRVATLLNPFPKESLIPISKEEFVWIFYKNYKKHGKRIGKKVIDGTLPGMHGDCCHSCRELYTMQGK